jgi:hypothetical protein
VVEVQVQSMRLTPEAVRLVEMVLQQMALVVVLHITEVTAMVRAMVLVVLAEILLVSKAQRQVEALEVQHLLQAEERQAPALQTP